MVLPWGKFEYQKPTTLSSNSPDIFQEKMNELCDGLEYVIAYINDLLIISNSNFEDHLNKVKISLSKLKAAAFKINAEIVFHQR